VDGIDKSHAFTGVVTALLVAGLYTLGTFTVLFAWARARLHHYTYRDIGQEHNLLQTLINWKLRLLDTA